MKSADEYQRQVMGGLLLDSRVDPRSHAALGIAGKSGEVADLIKKSQYRGGRLDKVALRLELGDALRYLTSIAGQMRWTLDDLMLANVRKLEGWRGYPYDSDALRKAAR